MGGGTEAFPDLGKHCEVEDCKQLDFLPFNCQACHKVYCLEHRSYKSHECPNSDQHSRRVVLCDHCSAAVETTGESDDRKLLETHRSSGECDPTKKKKKKLAICPVKRCREALTFSNSSVCKGCDVKVCLGHRFPTDHKCVSPMRSPEKMDRVWRDKFLAANNHSVKAC